MKNIDELVVLFVTLVFCVVSHYSSFVILSRIFVKRCSFTIPLYTHFL